MKQNLVFIYKLVIWFSLFIGLIAGLLVIGFNSDTIVNALNISDKELFVESIVVSFSWVIVGMIILFPEKKGVKEWNCYIF